MFHDRQAFDGGTAPAAPSPLADTIWAIRTEFCALIDELAAIRADRDPVYFLIKLGQLRAEARRCHLGALVTVAEKCEQALPRALQNGHARHLERDYAMLMRDAIDYGDLTPGQSEALLASVAYRMTG